MPCRWLAGTAVQTKGLLVHYDHGSQYASGRFQALLKD